MSSPDLFEERLAELGDKYIIPRDYKRQVIENAFARVRAITREEALKKVNKDDKPKHKNRIIVPLNYNPRLGNQSKILKKHHKAMLIKNQSLKDVFPEPPMAGLRQGPNLRRLLCRARLHPLPSSRPTRATQTAPGWRPCSHNSANKKQCPNCPLVSLAW